MKRQEQSRRGGRGRGRGRGTSQAIRLPGAFPRPRPRPRPPPTLPFLPLIAAFLISAAPSAAQDTVRVSIETDAGNIVAELYAKQAPVTVANFLRYVDANAYTNGTFHRTVRADNQPNDSVKIAVIQASANRAREGARFPAIVLERTSLTGLKHDDGTLSMARNGPDTATHSFSICVGAQPELDFGGRRKRGWPGLCRLWQSHSGNGCREEDQRSTGSGTNAEPADQDHRDQTNPGAA